MIVLDQKNFQKEVLESNQPALVEFTARWCPYCQMLKQVLNQLEQEFANKIKFIQIDIDQNSELAEEYEIMGVPTLIIFKNGQEIKRLVGLQYKEDLEKEIKNL